MARQTGIIKIKGKIGDISFYKTQDGHMAREKGGVDGDRIKKDPAFARTRENGAEFGSAAGASKLMRTALFAMLQSSSDNRLVSRLTKLMGEIKNLDNVSPRGERNVGTAFGIVPTAILKLRNFNFNDQSPMSRVLFQTYTVQTATGNITINNLQPIRHLSFPKGATHVTFKSLWLEIDFTAGTFAMVGSNPVNLPIDAAASNVALNSTGPGGTFPGIKLYILQVEFSQQVNGIQYPLTDKSHNSMCIVEVL